MANDFLLCRQCGVLFPLPAQPSDGTEPGAEEGDVDLELFRARHASHALEHATRSPSAAVHDRPVWDPMATSWFRVRTAIDELLVCLRRSSIEEPRVGHLQDGVRFEESYAVEVDERLLRMALDRHFYPLALPSNKLEKFVVAVRDVLRELDPASIETSFDDADYADAGIAPFPDVLCGRLLSRCTSIFDDEELDQLGLFVKANRAEDGVLALRVHRHVDVTP
jgi:hypothetical protein